MRKKLLISVCVFAAIAFFSIGSSAQNVSYDVIYPSSFGISEPLSELVKTHPFVQTLKQKGEVLESGDRKNRTPQTFIYSPADGPEYGEDPSVRQTEMGKRNIHSSKTLIKNWAGQVATSFRPMDPTGAAGTNHYVQSINGTPFRVYNKTSGTALLTANISTLWTPNTADDGDPIIMYDKYADRWFLSQFGTSGNKVYIAISTTNDPTGSYYTYSFTSSQFPDYLKFSIWENGYYMTSNQSTDRVYCFERDQMLAGNANARAVSSTFSTGTVDAFFVPLPADASDGGLPPAGTPLPFFAYYDNAWGGGNDGVKIWNMTVTWGTTPAATISASTLVQTATFDASYSSSWDDVTQPGTAQKLDGIGGVPTYRAQWRPWSTYNSLVMNWGVVISSTQRSIRWVELRQNQSTGVWSLYQEGTYAPDTHTRWLGSIAMDNNGSIALAYCKSSSTVYPSLCYTGRLPSDALGTMSVTEEVAIAGTSTQTSGNRFGDYSHTSLDPDGITFWHTGEYISGGVKTRIFSFQLPAATVPPVADFTANQTNVTQGTTVNFTDLSTQFPSSWSWTFAGGTPSTSTTQNPSIVYNTPGTYNVTLTVTNSFGNNTMTKTGYIVVGAISNPPVANFVASSTSISVGSSVSFTDLSTNSPTSWSWTFAGGTPGTSTSQNPTGITYNTVGTYAVTLVATNTFGSDSEVKTGYIVVDILPYCDAGVDATGYEHISNVTTTGFNNTSGDNGYSDFTSFSTNMNVGNPSTVTITIATPYSTDQVLVWIDYNHDSDFGDAGENVFTATTLGSATYTVTVTPPVTATAGSTTMRIRLHDTNTQYSPNATPCGNSGYGEVEDYSVNLISTTPVPPVADFVASATQIYTGQYVDFTNLSTGAPTSWSWSFTGGTPSTSNVQTPPSVLYSTVGVYQVSLTVSNTQGSDTETKVAYINVAEAPVTIVNWNFPNNPDDAVSDGGIPYNDGTKSITEFGGLLNIAYNAPGPTTQALTGDNWTSGMNTKGWVVDFQTTGYQDLKLSSKQLGQNRSPQDFKAQYSLNGTTWTDIPGATITIAGDWSTGAITEVSLPQQCENQTTVYVRWIMSSDTGISGTILASRDSQIDDIMVTGYLIVGQNEIQGKELNYRIYPNPNNGTFWFDINSEVSVQVTISDITGKTIYSDKISGNNQIDLGNPAQGVYFMQILSGNESFTELFIVK